MSLMKFRRKREPLKTIDEDQTPLPGDSHASHKTHFGGVKAVATPKVFDPVHKPFTSLSAYTRDRANRAAAAATGRSISKRRQKHTIKDLLTVDRIDEEQANY